MIPGWAAHFDWPDAFALSAPKPALILSGAQDGGYTRDEQQGVSEALAAHWQKQDAALEFHLYPGGHSFGRSLQAKA